MAFYFSSKQLPGLENSSVQERLEAINQANRQLTGPEKMLLNITKLLIITPTFLLLAWYYDQWFSVLIIVAGIAAYPLILRPLQLSLCAKYLAAKPDKQQ
ncbi:hypothetical protein KIH87_15755 [Paraneptunicella aestuarii]|uniref:DUF6170 family protein n=1 Tax=Paraneptunicella aestuarii TaxID=2831148 RepID=UPI001E543FC0|nr:DUF6170 family protein [Paraneptunicella aestuarii]UAA38127.1 hypothetical protein KIH87_15755 [Paraneptunicella aestuarii]